MRTIIDFFETLNPIIAALYAGLFTWAITAVGASVVFAFKKLSRVALDGMLGFAGGIMVAASFWSMLQPSIALSPGEGVIKALPAVIGFVFGALFLFVIDKILPHLHINFKEAEKEGVKTPWHKSILLTLAITLHNIPEGLALGILFGGAAMGLEGATLGAAVALAIGIAIQNLPEGMAISMSVRSSGMSRKKSFMLGQASAIVEPIAAVIGAWLVISFNPILPYALSFAAGAMIFVVIEEVIPESQRDQNTDIATLGFIGGFALMMMLDVMLS